MNARIKEGIARLNDVCVRLRAADEKAKTKAEELLGEQLTDHPHREDMLRAGRLGWLSAELAGLASEMQAVLDVYFAPMRHRRRS